MSSISITSTVSLYRFYSMTNSSNASASTQSAGSTTTSAKAATITTQDSSGSSNDSSDSGSDTNSDSGSDSGSSDSGSSLSAPNSQAAADLRTLAKDLQAGNTAAVAADEQKLQTDLAMTDPKQVQPVSSGHHHHPAFPSASATASNSGSSTPARGTINVTV